MVKQIQHIALILTLLLLGGTGNEAWGKVTYHILTLPFTTKKSDGTDRGTYIVEALRCTSDELTVGLPEYFKSPLASNFKYYAANNVKRNGVLESEGGSDARSQIYERIITTYDTYSIVDPSVKLTEGDVIADDSHVYVTYSYDNTTSPINLNGEEGRTIGGIVYNEDYNIALGDRFLCFNKARNNRVGAILATNVTNENLISNDFTYVTTNGFDSSHDFHFRFWYIGNDPYNITIQTSYVGDGTFIESDKWLNKNVKKWYKGSTLFCKGENDGRQNLWMASDDHIQYTQTDASGEVTYVSVPGYYRGGKNGESEMNPIWNSFAILQPDPTQGYIYIGSKINSNGNNWQPDSKNQYFYLTGNVEKGKNPRFQLKTPANVEKSEPYTIDTYTYKVTSLLGSVISVDVEMSNYEMSQSVLSYIPNAIRRKYVTFTGAYKTSDLDGTADNGMTTFEEAAANGKVIWLKYTSSMPFEALTSVCSYDNARWYTIRMNGDQENKYVAYYDTDNGNVMNTGSGRGSESDIHQGENSPEAKVAFIGDPFELKIICHKASEIITGAGSPAASDNRYVGCANASADGTPLSGDKTGSSDISSWEIVYENTQMETMILRQMGTVDAPKYIGWNYSASNRPMTYSTTGSRMKVVALDKKNYVYHIMRSDGTIAVKATEAQDVGRRLKYSTIPEVIRSPLIDPSVYTATITFYWSAADAVAGTNPHDHAPYDPATEGYDIYVRYTTLTSSLTKNYNVRLNGQYIYYNDENINSQADPVANDDRFVWHLNLDDPYSMKIKNMQVLKFLKKDGATWTDNQNLSWDATEANASLFIAKSSTETGIYEVMAATGDDIDATTDGYYNIGRPSANTVKMFANSTYAHGYAQLRFLLTPTDATVVEYHLYDKSGSELLKVKSRRPDLYFPADYRSPLVETYHYWTTSARNATLANLGSAADQDDDDVPDIYVTYDTSSRIDLQRGMMYLLKYEVGDSFRQENGSDGLTPSAVQAVYPYCNGDCNFFVYGQDEYDLQQQGAASTRTRWAWYLESTNNDPYHVKVCSRQTETYPVGTTNEHRGYFCTYAESWGPTGTKHVVTGLVWPGITGDQGTEYMVLGSVGQYQLVTTETVPVDQNNDGDYIDEGESNERHVVKSFEQYWKTFDTIRKQIFGDPASSISPEDPTIVPATPKFAVTDVASETDNRTYLENVMGFHHYMQWAYAKRWNGYNISGAKSKGWEEIEHWYQTVNMGEGYFNLIPVTIEPALILLDQHGWEIMRKPLPTDPDDPTMGAKYEAIRPYNSPMVKAYHFWGGAKKRTGFHQYYQLSGQIKVDGKNYTSTDLTKLPDYRNADGTINSTLFDKKSNLLDQYVTYVVKDEYAQSYDPSTGEGAKFLIQQGDNYASTSDGTTISTNAVATPGGMSQTIVAANGSFTDNQLWYLKPNTDIDIEMGYQDADKYPGGYAHDWTNDYTVTDFSTGFDPYNIQISSAAYTDKYFVTDATGAKIDDGEFVGNNSGTTVSLGVKATGVIGIGHDSRTMPITNATFMAVQDEDGNMQLMPRFDHTLRISNFSSLVVDQIGDAVKLPQTHTQLFRPAVYNYHIIDNSGNESLRYQSGGDLVPQMPEHFKSPLAKEFTFYKELACTNGITESFAGADKTAATNDVYVRYLYDEEADVNHILKGKWFTMQLNEKDSKYDNGIKYGDSKPVTIDGTEREWQWKFLETPQTVPDPYAVYLYNRSQAEGTEAIGKRFALLSHTSGDYALAEAGTGAYTYTFLNGTSMSTSVAATTAEEAGFTSTSCTFSSTGSQVKLIDDVVHLYNYKIYTNGTNGDNAVKYGVLAISGTQIQAEASQNEFVPILPHAIMTPLLNSDQFLYYEKVADMGNSAKELQYLYGLYEDDVYVRYNAYDPIVSGYKVPNQKTRVGSPAHVARGSGSNDTSLGLSGNLIYNIIWYDDNMMKSNGTAIADGGSKDILQTGTDYEWQLYGDDPYAIKIKSVKEDKYVYNSSSNSCTLSADNATTFMLLSKNEYDYGILQVTGDQDSRKLSGCGNTLATGDPTKYVIFALATYKVIYHLVLANIGSQTEEIPYREGDLPATPVAWTDADKTTFDGTTLRDLTSGSGATYQLGSTMTLGGMSKNYCYDAGAISLGAQLKVPDVFYRPNLDYFYYIEGVYDNDACTSPVTDMNNKYKGYALKNMGDDTGLLGKRILINIVYTFQGGLPTNAGDGFVTNASQNKWYTVETTTGDGTPWLAQYTNAWGLEMKEGRGTHYTNDYLWAPVGDPYGFQFYNRYIYKNSGDSNAGETDKVMTSTAFANNQVLAKGSNTDANSVYELLATSNDGYFMVHPVVNKTGTQYYFKTVNEPDGSVSVKLGTVPSEFRFGLSKELFDPYFRNVGYIGALKQSVCDDDANKALVEAMASSRELTAAELMEAQMLVYNDANLEPFVPGYYRLHSPSGIGGISPVRYASGYTHAIERDPNGDTDESDAIPMHFYEQQGEETTFELLPKQAGGVIGYTESVATRGELPISPVEYDPASIFYITGTAAAANMSTQGLNVYQNVMTTGAGTAFYLMDIGGGVFLIHDNATPVDERKYFCFDQADAAHIYDLKFVHDCHNTDHAKWCIQPANKLGLYIKTHSGGDEELYGTSYNYASFYAPFDILLPDTVYDAKDNTKVTKLYEAFICESKNSPWSPPADLHPKGISLYNIAANGCPSKKEEIEPGVERELFRSNNRFVPAGTPVLIAMLDDAGYVKVTLPNSSPSPALVTNFQADGDATLRDNIFSGVYLEQLLSIDASERVFTFGLPLTGSLTLDPTSGEILATLPSQDNTGLGFYLNANKNKELNGSQGGWDRNNRYVLGNRVYHLASGFPTALSREYTRGVEYVPVMFNDAEGVVEEGLYDNGREFVGDNCIYDLQGRCVATEQEVQNGTWHDRLAPGIYILNGRKFSKK